MKETEKKKWKYWCIHVPSRKKMEYECETFTELEFLRMLNFWNRGTSSSVWVYYSDEIAIR